MKEGDLKFGDWHRILFGEAPPAYLLEVVVRVAIIYLLIQICMRLLGKRMAAEVSRTERVARVSLAAAVGLTIQRPARGILSAIVIAIVIVAVGRWLAQLAHNRRWFEKAYQGLGATLIKDGVLNPEQMLEIRITNERLFAELRSQNIRHLGQVKRLYIEANGEFSIIKNEKEVPGLSIIPDWDTELLERQQKSDVQLCKNCGTNWRPTVGVCSRCQGKKYAVAVLLPAKKIISKSIYGQVIVKFFPLPSRLNNGFHYLQDFKCVTHSLLKKKFSNCKTINSTQCCTFSFGKTLC